MHGILSEQRAAAMTSRGRIVKPGSQYHAAALSFVLHAQSPFLPTLRGDVRIFMADGQFWGGGGVDLTIFYIHRNEISDFHKYWKNMCDQFDPSFYPQFKKQCDDYFYIPSREEHRGIGGLFYDDVVLPGHQLVQFQVEMLSNFLPSYQPIIEQNVHKEWTESQKRWQRIRRGRYLEFNLLNDRGVRFGLASANASPNQRHGKSSGRTAAQRTDSIMISAPPSIEWPYAFSPAPGSPEEETLRLLQTRPIDWVNGDAVL